MYMLYGPLILALGHKYVPWAANTFHRDIRYVLIFFIWPPILAKRLLVLAIGPLTLVIIPIILAIGPLILAIKLLILAI